MFAPQETSPSGRRFKLNSLGIAVAAMALMGSPAFAAEPAAAAAPPAVAAKAVAKVLPGDDFYEYVNGDWLASVEIPADLPSWSDTAAVARGMEANLIRLIEKAGADKSASSHARKVHAYYAAFLNEAAIEARGIAPLKPQLDEIAAIQTRQALAKALGATLRADVDPLNATNYRTENLFGLWVAQGMNDPEHNRAYLLQGGLSLPSRGIYLGKSPRAADARARFEKYVADLMQLAGYADTAARAARVMALEMKIAAAHASEEDSNDVQKANNSWTPAEFASKAPGMDWTAFFSAAKLADQGVFGVWQPEALKGLAALVGEVDLDSWKDYLAFHAINGNSRHLPKAFADLRFELYGKALSGTQAQGKRESRAFGAVNGALPDAVGQMYVEAYFPAQHKARLQKIVDNIKAAFSQRIDKLDWMAPETRAQAQAKLKSLYVGIGFPDRWASYEGLVVLPDDAFGNAQRASRHHYEQQIAKLHQKVDRTEWAMAPQTIDAINLPLQNALNFPAAILQAPMYDAEGTDASIYGGIGSVIGHEISHSFDNMGAQFDARGVLRNWWTEADLKQFQKATAALVAQYSAYQPFPDLAVNGELTLGENLSDLAGLAAAYDAYKAVIKGKPGAAEADRDFFTSYARAWRMKAKEAMVRRMMATDEHAPPKYRIFTVRNLDAWYQAFDVKPGQAMYLKPQERVRVW